MRQLPVCLAAAGALGSGLGLVVPISADFTCAAVVACLVASAISLARRAAAGVLTATLGGIVFATWTLAAANDRVARDPPLAAVVGKGDEAIDIEGWLLADAAPDGDAVRLRIEAVRAGGVTVLGGEHAALSVGGSMALAVWPAWRAGRRIAAPATLRRPAMYLDEGVGDDRLALARHGLVVVGRVKSGALVRVLENGSWLEERAADLRRFVRQAIARHVARRDPVAGAIATAILIGDRTGLDPALEDRLQAAGTYHVIAISGGNIAIFATTVLVAAWLLRVPASAASVGTIAALWAYASLVGGGASVQRATAMATVYLGLRVLDLRAPPIAVLSATAAGMLIAAPLIAVDASFLLTCGATAAIVTLAGRLAAFARWPRLMAPAAMVVAASVATELVLLPVAARLFGRVTVAGPLINLAAVPAMVVIQQASMGVVIAASWWPWLADLCGAVAVLGADVLVRSADLVSWMPGLARRVPAPAWWVVTLYLSAGALTVALPSLRVPGRWRMRVRRVAATVAAFAAIWIVVHPGTWRTPWHAAGRLHVTSIDVGQGDATLVELPDTTTLLVDAGGLGGDARFDVGARVVAPTIWARGIGWLDGLLLTHGDPDHIGGAPAIVDLFRPSVVWEGVVVPLHAPMAVLRSRAVQGGLPWRTLTAGQRWERAGVRFTIWNPPIPDWDRRQVRNDDSIVLELTYGAVSIVLPGDIGHDVEDVLAAEIPPSPVRVLKVAHHGSATSSSERFLDALRPSLALVSCGRDNRFGHPAPVVLARLAARGVRVYRTDQDGEIDLATDGARVDVRTRAHGP